MKLYDEKKRNAKVELRKAQKDTEIKKKQILNETENLIDHIKSTNKKNIDESSNNQFEDLDISNKSKNNIYIQC